MIRSLQNSSSANTIFKVCLRGLTSTEVSTALRPFYFSVHPDLFGQYPNERAINESSLQQLSSVLTNIQASRPVRPISLSFYVKDKTQKTASFRFTKIHLKDRDIRSTIVTILKSCGLPTDYVDSIIPPPKIEKPDYSNLKYKNEIDLTKENDNHPIFAHVRMQRKIKEAQEALKLRNFLITNHRDALDKSEKGAVYREEITKLKKQITAELGLKEIQWNCGWNDTHFRGCLLSFLSLTEHHPEIRNVLKGRILVFSYFTGISLEGHVMLYSGEVRHNWLDFIKNIAKYDKALTRIPAFEKSLSHVLRNIKVGRRKFMPKIMAGTYEQNLKQITTSLSDFRGCRSFPKEWPDTLKDYEMVVETEAGPLMVSPTGQFIVPSSIPGELLVNFITKNLHLASQRNREYQNDKHLERALTKQCLEKLQLSVLLKDDNVTPDLMIKCCTKLLNDQSEIERLTPGLRLNIATYYSVLSDGVICIPWNYDL
nr:T-cell activation inhibitor, mitochondrial isoform X1 [Leptinotarsa decemlineata]